MNRFLRIYIYIGMLALLPFLSTEVRAQNFVSISPEDYPVTSTALPIVEEQAELGWLLPTDTFSIAVEYPETEPLSAAEVKMLRGLGFEAEERVQFHVLYSKMRGKTFADINFVPVVKQGGRWMRVTNYLLRVRNLGPKVMSSVRSLAQRVEAAVASTRYAENSVLSQGKWVKIRVKDEGIYQISDSKLASWGFNDPSKVKLYGYGGRLLPDTFTFTGSDALIDDLCEVPLCRREGSVLFFAEGLTRWEGRSFKVNTFSNYSYYFLTEGENPLTLETAADFTPSSAAITQVPAYAVVDNDAFVWYGGGRDFYDSNELQGSGHTFKLKMPGCESEEVSIYYDVSAKSTAASTRVSFLVDNAEVASTQIGKYSTESESAKGRRGVFTVAAADALNIKVATTNTGRLNYLYAVYPQHLEAGVTTHAFTCGQSGKVSLEVASATSGTRVWQLQTADSPLMQLPGELDGGSYVARAASGNSRFVIVDLNATYDTPEFAGEIENQNLHADEKIDYVILVPASGKLTAQAERLAQSYREEGNLRVKVVRADQIYNEFSSGTPDANAVRRYMKMLYDRAATDADAPRYLLLFGESYYDNRMITSDWKGTNPDDFLLACERNDQETYFNSDYSIGTLHSYVSDDYYALLDDGEGSRPPMEKIDLGVGRFLCRDEASAARLVDVSIAYRRREQTGAWKNRIWVTGDSGDNNLHMNDAQAVVSQFTKNINGGMILRKNYPDAYAITLTAQGGTYPEARAKFKQAMQQGALWLNYNGHGGPSYLSHNFLLTQDDVRENSGSSSPLWVFASCEITPFDQAITDLGRLALANEKSPALAVVCASRSVYSNYNRALNMGLATFAFRKNEQGERYTLGDAMRLTKSQLISNSTVSIGIDQSINKMKYVLLGDPAVALSYPEERLVIDSVNGQPLSSALAQLEAGGEVSFSGYVAREKGSSVVDTGFNGTLTGTFFTPAETIKCKGYGCTTADPLTYTDYTKTLFEGSVDVVGGRFTLRLMIPLGIKLSADPGLLVLYAVSADSLRTEYNGSFDRFCFNGISSELPADSVPPHVYVYLDRPDFPDGGIVGTSPVFFAHIADSVALSMMSGNLGHDMELWLDDKRAESVSLNDWFRFDNGSFAS
ncbi:MAG: type IX secretion system sortase PorU, partial [Alloprevotella sp.]